MVGSAIIRKLISLGYRNIVSNYHHRKPELKSHDVKRFVQIDLRRQSDVHSFFKNEKPEYIFLAAAKVGGILANNTYKAEFIYDNTMIAANVIDAAHKSEAKKLLNLGSSCIYPKLAPQPMKENFLLSGELEPTNEPYAIAKIAAIKLCRYYNEQYGTNFISVMPTNLYGPHDNFNLETSHVLPALMRKLYLARLLADVNHNLKYSYQKIKQDLKLYSLGFNFNIEIEASDFDGIKKLLSRKFGISDKYVRLWGSGIAEREFLYVDDLASASIFLMKNFDYEDIGEFINIGTGNGIKIKDLANLIKDIVGFNGKIEYDRSKPDGMPQKVLDLTRSLELGWKPKIGLKDGIMKVYKWYTAGEGSKNADG